MIQNKIINNLGVLSCVATLGLTTINVGANNVPNVKNVEYSTKATTFKFNPNDKLIKKALAKAKATKKIKGVALVVKAKNRTTFLPMDKQADGTYVKKVSGNQDGNKYQYAIQYTNGETYTINNPYAKNAENVDTSIVGAKSIDSSDKIQKSNITITTPDGIVIDITGTSSSETSKKDDVDVSVTSSSKIGSSSKLQSSSNEVSDVSSSSSEPAHAAVIQSSVSQSMTNSSSSKTNSNSNSASSEPTHAPVIQSSVSQNSIQKEDNQSVNSNSEHAAVVQSTNKSTKDSNNQSSFNSDNKGNSGGAAVVAKSQVNSSSINSSSTNESNKSNDLESTNNTETPSESSSDESQSMPQTGERVVKGLSLLGMALLVTAGGVWFYSKHKKSEK